MDMFILCAFYFVMIIIPSLHYTNIPTIELFTSKCSLWVNCIEKSIFLWMNWKQTSHHIISRTLCFIHCIVIMYSVHCTLYTVHCIVYTVQRWNVIVCRDFIHVNLSFIECLVSYIQNRFIVTFHILINWII